MNEFHDKEMQQLMESHDKLVEQLEEVKQKVEKFSILVFALNLIHNI